MAPEDATAASKAAKWIKLGIIAGVIGVLLYFGGATAKFYFKDFAEWVKDFGAWGPAIFILVYAVGAILWIPGSLLTLLAGALFGVVQGTAFVFIASTSAALGSFLIARYLARRFVERKMAGNQRFAAIDRAIGQQGFKIAFLMRLSPVFPFVLLNYALGLTQIRFRDFALACFGTLPGTILYVFYGDIGRAALLAGDMKAEMSNDLAGWITKGVAFVATIIVTMIVTRIARRALKESANVGN